MPVVVEAEHDNLQQDFKQVDDKFYLRPCSSNFMPSEALTNILPLGKKYHAFFVYRNIHPDKDWVKRVREEFEKRGLHCGTAEKKLKDGEFIQDSFVKCLKESRKVIIVLSKQFLADEGCLFQLHLSHALLMSQVKSGRYSIIPLILDDCEPPEWLSSVVMRYVGGEPIEWWNQVWKAVQSDSDLEKTDYFDKNQQPDEASVLQTYKHTIQYLMSSNLNTQMTFLRISIESGMAYFTSQLGEDNMFTLVMKTCGIQITDTDVFLKWFDLRRALKYHNRSIQDLAYHCDKKNFCFNQISIAFSEDDENQIDRHMDKDVASHFVAFLNKVLQYPIDPCSDVRPCLRMKGHVCAKSVKQTYDVILLLMKSPNLWKPTFVEIDKNFRRRYEKYKARLKTFKEWPKAHPMSPEAIAEAGFVCTGMIDVAICFSCGLGIYGWNTDPWLMHCLFKPSCTFLRDEKGDSFIKNMRKKDRNPPRLEFHEYSTTESRLKTYRVWNFNNRMKAEHLAEAGFYQLPSDNFRDTVRCFSCGVHLCDWSKDMDPWKEHVKWSPDCKFLLQEKGCVFRERYKLDSDSESVKCLVTIEIVEPMVLKRLPAETFCDSVSDGASVNRSHLYYISALVVALLALYFCTFQSIYF